ncbi:unnamed protein product [Acidithrix sp. C25]|nr:unnamed protein product [Acidithrix sp. C25]
MTKGLSTTPRKQHPPLFASEVSTMTHQKTSRVRVFQNISTLVEN